MRGDESDSESETELERLQAFVQAHTSSVNLDVIRDRTPRLADAGHNRTPGASASTRDDHS